MTTRPVTTSASAGLSASAGYMGVSMYPGLTEFTRIPRGAREAAKVRARLCTAALVAEYTVRALLPRCRVQEALMTTDPPSTSSGSAFWTVKKTPLRLTSTVWSKSSSVMSSNARIVPVPALAKRLSSRPCRSRTNSISAAIAPRSPVSATAPVALGPSSATAASTRP